MKPRREISPGAEAALVILAFGAGLVVLAVVIELTRGIAILVALVVGLWFMARESVIEERAAKRRETARLVRESKDAGRAP